MTPEERHQKRLERQRVRYSKNREKELARMRKWREENLELKRQIMKESARRRRAEHPEQTRAIQSKSRANESLEQRENRLAKIREWHREHQAEVREYGRQWRRQHPGLKAKWRRKNPEKTVAARAREYKNKRVRIANDPETANAYHAYFAASTRARRARNVPTPGHHTLADIEALYEAQNGKCAGCQKPFAKSGKHRFHVDHIIPLKPRNGGIPGSNGPENLQLLCRPCNSSKNNWDHAEWINRRKR